MYIFIFIYLHVASLLLKPISCSSLYYTPRKSFKFHRVVGGDGFDSDVAKPVSRGFTPPFKQPPSTSNIVPKSGLTPASGLTCSLTSKSLSDQTVRSRPFTSSRLSLPQGSRAGQATNTAEAPPIHRVTAATLSLGRGPTGVSLENDKSVVSGSKMHKSSPPIAFVSPVVSNTAIHRSAFYTCQKKNVCKRPFHQGHPPPLQCICHMFVHPKLCRMEYYA